MATPADDRLFGPTNSIPETQVDLFCRFDYSVLFDHTLVWSQAVYYK